MLSEAATTYLGKMLRGDYTALWITSPANWYLRAKRGVAHGQRLGVWIQRAIVLKLFIIIYGLPGYLWKLPNIVEILKDEHFTLDG